MTKEKVDTGKERGPTVSVRTTPDEYNEFMAYKRGDKKENPYVAAAIRELELDPEERMQRANLRRLNEVMGRYTKAAEEGETDPDVAKAMEQIGWSVEERPYRRIIDYTAKMIKEAEADYKAKKEAVKGYYDAELGSYGDKDSDFDQNGPFREAAMDGVGGFAKLFESGIRGLANIPLTFVKNYSNKAIDLSIDTEPVYTEGAIDLAKKRASWNIKDSIREQKAALEREKDEALEKLDIAYKSRVAELAGHRDYATAKIADMGVKRRERAKLTASEIEGDMRLLAGEIATHRKKQSERAEYETSLHEIEDDAISVNGKPLDDYLTEEALRDAGADDENIFVNGKPLKDHLARKEE